MTARQNSRGVRIGGLQFSGTELKDLLVAWIALGIAFAIFFEGGAGAIGSLLSPTGIVLVFVSLATAGVAFLFHEVGHKVVAVRYDQIAEFRADHGMLFLAVMSALLGFIFAAPGAVHHRGRITHREHGHIALAGPAVNLVLSVVFVPILFIGFATASDILSVLGARGVAINLFLAAFNLIPYGPLDGRTVITWSKPVWAITFAVSAIATVGFLISGAGVYAF
ncbi:metalloprotease [Halopenitus sp. H-Gu1]|uniref:metalloprotease n=1 Tax=Halopenitus sp. H-Gu1 TaxID=3242697 RepID=UPI00359EE8EC